MDAQVIWLGPEATDYAAECDACLADRRLLSSPYSFGPYCSAHLEGRLSPEADVGFTTCARGHRIRLRRITVSSRRRRRRAAAAARAAAHAS